MQKCVPSHFSFVFTFLIILDCLSPFQAPPKYAFKYGVNDYHTGDVKSQVNLHLIIVLLFLIDTDCFCYCFAISHLNLNFISISTRLAMVMLLKVSYTNTNLCFFLRFKFIACIMTEYFRTIFIGRTRRQHSDRRLYRYECAKFHSIAYELYLN